jgi:hypothetical protein
MLKNNLIKLKSIFITRSGGVFWYVDTTFGEENTCISLGSNLDRDLSWWNDELLAHRDSMWYYPDHNAREDDVIYLYEILDMSQFLDLLRENRFFKYPELFNNGYTNEPWVKLIWERIDSVLEN